MRRSRSASARCPCRSRFRRAISFSLIRTRVAAKITPRTRMLLTNSPGNPTGTVYTDAVQRALAELAVKHDLWVLSDEIYARIIYGGEYLVDAALSRNGRAHADHRRILQELRHDGMATGIHSCSAGSGSSAGDDGGEYIHLRCRVHAVCRDRCACATAKATRRGWSASLPAGGTSSRAT